MAKNQHDRDSLELHQKLHQNIYSTCVVPKTHNQQLLHLFKTVDARKQRRYSIYINNMSNVLIGNAVRLPHYIQNRRLYGLMLR